MTKDEERKKIVEAMIESADIKGEIEKRLKEKGFRVEQSAEEGKSKKKANL